MPQSEVLFYEFTSFFVGYQNTVPCCSIPKKVDKGTVIGTAWQIVLVIMDGLIMMLASSIGVVIILVLVIRAEPSDHTDCSTHYSTTSTGTLLLALIMRALAITFTFPINLKNLYI